MPPARFLLTCVLAVACTSPEDDVELPPGSSLGAGEVHTDPESLEARLCARAASCFELLPEIGEQGCTGFLYDCVGALQGGDLEQWLKDAEACTGADGCSCVTRVYTCNPGPVSYNQCGDACKGCYAPDGCPPDVNRNGVCDCACGSFDPECL